MCVALKEKKSRKQREQEQRKTYILECAEELFAENGFDNTSMVMIAEKSEFSVGTVYNFFQSKSEIYSELAFRKMTDIYEGMHKISEIEFSADDKITEIMRHSVGMINKQRRYIKVYMNDLARMEWGLPTLLSKRETEIHQKTQKVIANILKQAQKELILREDISINTLNVVLRQIIKGYLLIAMTDSEELDVDCTVNEMRDIFFNGAGVKK